MGRIMKKYSIFIIALGLLLGVAKAHAKDSVSGTTTTDTGTATTGTATTATGTTGSTGKANTGPQFISTDQARQQGSLESDSPSVDDPYMNKTPTARDLHGAPLTQGSYENCTAEHCVRAEKRQTTEGTTWRDDVNSGAKKGGY
jgi:hypothetical protein